MDVALAIQEPEYRESFIEDIVLMRFNREAVGLQALGQDSNNYAYLIDLGQVIDAEAGPAVGERPPGTVQLPAEVDQVVIRLSNPSANLNEDCRVENEVAAMILARHALEGTEWEDIVPQVYGWGPPGRDCGWMIQEYKRGECLEHHFDELRVPAKRKFIHQIVSIFKHFQDYRPPESIRGYGCLAFNDAGQIVTGQSLIPTEGSSRSLSDVYVEYFFEQLHNASHDRHMQVWYNTRLRDRLENFGNHRLRDLVTQFAEDRPTLVHGDMNTYNILFDPDNDRITALLDFDFAHIGSPADEYFHSFSTLSSILVGPLEAGDVRQLRNWILRGFAGFTTPIFTGRTFVDWDAAEIMNDELEEAGVRRPVDMPGCGELAGLKWFSEDLCAQPYAVAHWLGNLGIKDAGNIGQFVQQKLEYYLMRY